MLEKPDIDTVALHELTHAKFEPWCFHCVSGRGTSSPHPTQYVTDKPTPIPVVQLDYHFLKDDGEEAEDTGAKVGERFATTLAVVDCDSATPIAAHHSGERGSCPMRPHRSKVSSRGLGTPMRE